MDQLHWLEALFSNDQFRLEERRLYSSLISSIIAYEVTRHVVFMLTSIISKVSTCFNTSTLRIYVSGYKKLSLSLNLNNVNSFLILFILLRFIFLEPIIGENDWDYIDLLNKFILFLNKICLSFLNYRSSTRFDNYNHMCLKFSKNMEEKKSSYLKWEEFNKANWLKNVNKVFQYFTIQTEKEQGYKMSFWLSHYANETRK